MTAPRSTLPPPEGYLMRLEAAATELGLGVADLLEYAEELDATGAPLRVCVRVPDDALITPVPVEIRESLSVQEPPGMKPAERRFAYIHAPNTPGFFYELAEGAATLGSGDSLALVDGSGMVLWAEGMMVRLEGLRVPREDIEGLRALASPPPSPARDDGATEPTRMRNRRWVHRAKAMLIEQPAKFAKKDGKPVFRTLARALCDEGVDLQVDTLRDILRDEWDCG